MTKYANTPAGRAAAAADMAATGTTMGPRPTGPKGPMVRPGVPSGPKIGVRPADPKPANPRVTYGPRGPRGYGPNDGGPRPMGPRITPVDVTGMPAGGPKTGVMPTRRAMRGGGLARKGVGMALAKGGLARRAGGCAKRGVGRGKIT